MKQKALQIVYESKFVLQFFELYFFTTQFSICNQIMLKEMLKTIAWEDNETAG